VLSASAPASPSLLASALVGAGSVGLLVVVLMSGCGAPLVAAPQPLSGAQFGEPCRRDECGEGLVCRYEGQPGAFERRCGLDVGRCRDSLDCAPSMQRCMRLNERLGVCQSSGI
jgi:hypothetical protein